MGSKLVGVFAVLSIGATVAWAATTGPPAAKKANGPGYGYAGAKVTICHRAGPNRLVTIRVSERALRGHLRHGDTIGACR